MFSASSWAEDNATAEEAWGKRTEKGVQEQDESGLHYREAVSWPVSVYIAGDYWKAKDSLRMQTLEEGLCVTLEAVDFVYTGGCESGVRVGLCNYPRFPKEPHEIESRARKVAMILLDALHQQSCMVETPAKTYWWSRRPEDMKESK